MKHWTLEYLLSVLETKDWSMNKLAAEAQVAASTINRPLREKDWSFALSPRTVGKIHTASGIDPTPFMPKGMEEPQAMFLGESHKPRPKSYADAALSNLINQEREEGAHPTDTSSEIKIAIVGRHAQISATVDKTSIAELRKKLDAIESILDD